MRTRLFLQNSVPNCAFKWKFLVLVCRKTRTSWWISEKVVQSHLFFRLCIFFLLSSSSFGRQNVAVSEWQSAAHTRVQERESRSDCDILNWKTENIHTYIFWYVWTAWDIFLFFFSIFLLLLSLSFFLCVRLVIKKRISAVGDITFEIEFVHAKTKMTKDNIHFLPCHFCCAGWKRCVWLWSDNAWMLYASDNEYELHLWSNGPSFPNGN